MRDLAKTNVIVTGASRGLGARIAQRFALRAIRKDRAEILVSPGPMRLFQALNQLAPEVFSRLTSWLGATNVFRQVALAERGTHDEPR